MIKQLETYDGEVEGVILNTLGYLLNWIDIVGFWEEKKCVLNVIIAYGKKKVAISTYWRTMPIFMLRHFTTEIYLIRKFVN